MLVNVCIAKLHRATVTDADLGYMGSITIDETLLTAAGLLPGQMVTINNLKCCLVAHLHIEREERKRGYYSEWPAGATLSEGR